MGCTACPLQIGALTSQTSPRKTTMSTEKIKQALVTTGIVLAVIYVLNMTPAKPFVQKAING